MTTDDTGNDERNVYKISHKTTCAGDYVYDAVI